MSAKTAGRTVGLLLLLAFLLYGGGAALVVNATGDPVDLKEVAAAEAQLRVGALLMLLNSAAVATVGVVALPVLRRYHPLTAYAYLATRIVECLLLAVGVVLLLMLIPLAATQASEGQSLATVLQQGSTYAYWTGMAALGLGSLLFCRVLIAARLVPRALGVWGFVGYAVFAIGAVAELLGYEIGLPLSIPGGLFEVMLGIVLLRRGFPDGPNDEHPGVASPLSMSLPQQPTRHTAVAR